MICPLINHLCVPPLPLVVVVVVAVVVVVVVVVVLGYLCCWKRVSPLAFTTRLGVGFPWVSLGCYRVFTEFSAMLPGFTGFHWV